VIVLREGFGPIIIVIHRVGLVSELSLTGVIRIGMLAADRIGMNKAVGRLLLHFSVLVKRIGCNHALLKQSVVLSEADGKRIQVRKRRVDLTSLSNVVLFWGDNAWKHLLVAR